VPDGRQLRGLRSNEVVRAFERLGYRVDRISGSHCILEHPSRPPLQIPYHAGRVVAEGLLRSQIRCAGFTVDEFEAAL
jgi:predicted RNA binding protein YcfA (HicA-like mRNA interferase family)